MMDDIQATQTMENNLKRLVKNQNYFSCFFQNREPSNPFQKRLFEKKLRRSTVSCSDNYHHQSQIRELDNLNNNNRQKQPFCLQFQQRIQRTTSIVKNQIELLKEKLMQKQQIIMKDSRISLTKKKMLLSNLAQNVQKTSSFIIQNCLHIQEEMLFPSYTQIEERQQLRSQYNKQNIQQMNNLDYQQHQIQNKKLYQSNVQIKNIKVYNSKSKQCMVEGKRNNQIIKDQENTKHPVLTSNPSSNNNSHHHSCQNKYHFRQTQPKQHKSIYEAVLDQRQRRLKNLKKKLV